jgi:hypothetical protein
VLGQAGELVARDPVGHNVVATKLADAIGYSEPGRYWIGLLDGVPAGVAVQHPAGTSLAVAPMPMDLVPYDRANGGLLTWPPVAAARGRRPGPAR